MTLKSGRPKNDSKSRQKIIDAAAKIISDGRAEEITVRKICEIADVSIGTFYHYFNDKDGLMMYFLREAFYGSELKIPLRDIAARITELYMQLINKYMKLGKNFMKSFYTTNNNSLSAYMCEHDGKFLSDTIMARSEREINEAVNSGIIKSDSNVHLICQDICTIVKGCVFEWCLNNSKIDIEMTLNRIIKNYLSTYIKNEEQEKNPNPSLK